MSPGELDPQVVRRHLIALHRALAVLDGHTGATSSRLEGDPEERWMIERGLHLCAQNVLDIATHIAAVEGHDVPDYASAIDGLGSSGVLPKGFAAEFRALAGFRNVLVHGYLAVDLQMLTRMLNERLVDFRVFAEHIDSYLEESGKSSD